MTDNTKAWKNKNINFRVTKKPEQVLIQNRITTTGRIKECRAKISIRQQHGNRTGKYRQRQQQQKGCDKNGPDEKWHLVQCHAGGTHIEDSRNKVNGTQNG